MTQGEIDHEQRPQWRLGRLAQLLLLAVTVLVYSVLTIAIANSMFVSQVGAGQLPYAFMLIGICSLLAYTGFSQVVDRYSRPKLFQVALLVSSLLVVGLWGLLHLDQTMPYYLLLVVAFFQWDFYNNILYPSLLTDYFTSLEYKQYAPYIGIAQAVGTLVGGGITTGLSRVLHTQELLLCLPLIFAIALCQLIYLNRTQPQLEILNNNAHDGILATLKAVPALVSRFPLILFLAASSFLLVILYTSSEYLWFSIYSQHFSEDDLTGFLGLMRVVISVVQVGMLYGFTRPLLRWLGVAQMNPVYPLTTLASFINLALNLKLPGAIALQLNGDALYKSVNLPVHQLNYNAIPRDYIGRVRTLSDGIIYAMGLTLAGGLLWICERYFSLAQTTYLLAGISFVLLLVRLPMGRFYAQGLEALIRANAIDLDDFSQSQPLPPQSNQVIRELLSEGDRYTQLKALEYARIAEEPLQFLPEVLALVPEADDVLRDRILHLFASIPSTELHPFETLLSSPSVNLQTMALEVLITHQYAFSRAQLQTLQASPSPVVQVLVSMALHQIDPTDQHRVLFHQMAQDASVSRTLLRVVRRSANQTWVPLVADILPQADSGIKRQCLKALLELATEGDEYLAQLVVGDLAHSDAMVRLAALKVLAVAQCPDTLPAIATCFGDLDPRVRQQAAQALAGFGQQSLTLAQAHLNSGDEDRVNTAIAAIGQVRTKAASNVLYHFLSADFQQLTKTRQWQRQIPAMDAAWQPLAVAIANYHKQLVQRVLYILACLGHSRTVNLVSRILATTNQKDRANAVEVLASLSDRRFMLPLLPLLEADVKPLPEPTPGSGAAPTSIWLRTKGYTLLLEALESSDRWIRTGALIALAHVPAALVKDPDPLVQSVAQELVPTLSSGLSSASTLMNRLLLLKDVALFKNLSLDELLLIEQALEPESVRSGDTIFSEGSWGTHLYIIGTGTVKLVKTIEGKLSDLKHLGSGSYFGEIALFDDAHRWNGAIATSDCTLFKLEKSRFISLITQRPHIILELCRFLSQQLRETDTYLSPKPLVSSSSPSQVIPN